MKFKCDCCGIEQDEYPAIGYQFPLYYSSLSEEEKESLAEINSDTCVVKEAENTFRFIRGVLIQKVKDGCQNLEYGLWVSLSESSFRDYIENSNKEDHQETYFGWLNSTLPDYKFEEMESIKANVLTQGKGRRPLIEIQSNEGNASKFLEDYRNGISEEEALRRIERIL